MIWLHNWEIIKLFMQPYIIFYDLVFICSFLYGDEPAYNYLVKIHIFTRQIKLLFI